MIEFETFTPTVGKTKSLGTIEINILTTARKVCID